MKRQKQEKEMMRKKKKMKKKRKKEKPGEALKKSRHEGGSIGEGRSKVDALSYWYQSCVDISDSLGCKPPLPVADGYPRASADRWLGLVARPDGAAWWRGTAERAGRRHQGKSEAVPLSLQI